MATIVPESELDSSTALLLASPSLQPAHKISGKTSTLIAAAAVVAGLVGVVVWAGSNTQPVVGAHPTRAMQLASLKPCQKGDEDEDSPCSPVELDLDSIQQRDAKTQVPDVSKCSWGQQNCNATKCCNNPGAQCYEQNNITKYAQCRESCVPGPNPSHWDGQWWTCKALGERAEGEIVKCSEPGEDCSKTQCCNQPNTQCFEKVDGWATCKSQCTPDAPDLSDVDSNWWSCKTLGPWTQGAAPWVPAQCSVEGEDCRATKCCQAPGAQCFEQSADWAACKYDCSAGVDPERTWEPAWSCNELGQRTAGAGPPPPSTMSAWAQSSCAWDGGDCTKSRCCIAMNQQCYEKNDDWAVCKQACTPGYDLFDNNETWTCRELGSRSMGLAVKGNPPIFCWSLFQLSTYEGDVMKLQMSLGAGIFQCDSYALLSTADESVIGQDSEGKDVKTLHVDMAEITTSVDGTAGNAKLFINCWNVIVQDGRWNNHAWTIKVDPDAVILADRLRTHLAPHVMENVYVVNCNKFPSSPNFPMMYGSLEIFSWKAIQTYANNMQSCMTDMGSMLPLWGEDYFMTHCLDHIGVGRISDFTSVGDGVCLGANCGDWAFAAFHPFKTVDDWQNCWNAAQR